MRKAKKKAILSYICHYFFLISLASIISLCLVRVKQDHTLAGRSLDLITF